jgi:hypothetical protein
MKTAIQRSDTTQHEKWSRNYQFKPTMGIKMHRDACIIIIKLTLLLFSSNIFADGIPVSEDRKNLIVENITISLSPKQIDSVEKRRHVILTGSQLKRLREKYSKIPNKLSVLSSRYNDCTCDMGVYAVWTRPGKIQIPFGSIDAQKEMDSELQEDEKRDTKEESSSDELHKRIIFDSKGQMYIKGSLVTETMVKSIIDDLAQKASKAKDTASIMFDTPPPINNTIDNKIMALSSRLEEYAKHNNNIICSAYGLSDENISEPPSTVSITIKNSTLLTVIILIVSSTCIYILLSRRRKKNK